MATSNSSSRKKCGFEGCTEWSCDSARYSTHGVASDRFWCTSHQWCSKCHKYEEKGRCPKWRKELNPGARRVRMEPKPHLMGDRESRLAIPAPSSRHKISEVESLLAIPPPLPTQKTGDVRSQLEFPVPMCGFVGCGEPSCTSKRYKKHGKVVDRHWCDSHKWCSKCCKYEVNRPCAVVVASDKKRHAIQAEKAKRARAAQMCPGFKDHGCKAFAACAPGCFLCVDCQNLRNSKGLVSVVKHLAKKAEADTGITITVPFSVQLTELGSGAITSQLDETTLRKLQVRNVVSVDTSITRNSCEVMYMRDVGAIYVDDNGGENLFWAVRGEEGIGAGVDDNWLSAKWRIFINDDAQPGGDIFTMLASFASFVCDRQIVFYTGNSACDHKRLTSAYEFSAGKQSPFPAESTWFNIGKDLIAPVIGNRVRHVIKSSNWQLSYIESRLYQTKSSTGEVLHSVPYPKSYIDVSVRQQLPDSVKDAILALNVLNCFKIAVSN